VFGSGVPIPGAPPIPGGASGGCADNNEVVKSLFVEEFQGCSDFKLSLNGIWCWKPFEDIDDGKFKDANEAREKYNYLGDLCTCFCIKRPGTLAASSAANLRSLKSVNKALKKALKAALN